VSNPDSFIDEVTEEVRRDRLFALMRRYGWIAVLGVLLLVGGAAAVEWRKAQAQAQARAFGDAVLAALEADTPAARRAALAAVATGGTEQAAIVQLLLASDPAEDRPAALAALETVAADAALPQIWRDLAVLRRVTLAGPAMPAEARRAALDPLAAPGRPMRPLALEALAYLAVEAGDRAAAIVQLQALIADQETPAGLRTRAGQMVTALGGGRAGA
jgi:hypothetical protein